MLYNRGRSDPTRCMRCPACDHPEDRVIDSRPLESASVIRRRRSCVHCGKRFTTYERVESTPLMVVKRDNRREPFRREKMREGIVRACQKRPISPAAIEKLVSEVEYSLQDFVLEVRGGGEISSGLTAYPLDFARALVLFLAACR